MTKIFEDVKRQYVIIQHAHRHGSEFDTLRRITTENARLIQDSHHLTLTSMFVHSTSKALLELTKERLLEHKEERIAKL